MKSKIILLLVTFLGLTAILLVHAPKVHALYTGAVINCQTTDKIHCLVNGTTTAYNWDSGCKNYLNSYANTSYTLRDVIDGNPPGGGSASYVDSTWPSARNNPNNTAPVTVNYGATSVPLQINSTTFLCGTMVWSDDGWGASPAQPSSKIPQVIGETSRWVPNAGQADDRKPNAVGGGNLLPARTGNDTQIESLTVSAGCPPGSTCTVTGYSTGTTKDVMSVARDNNSRYWFATPDNIVFNSSLPIKADTTIKLTLNYKYIAEYGSTDRCDGGSINITVPGPTAFGACQVQSRVLTLALTVINIPDNPPQIRIGVVNQPTCTSGGNINGSAWDNDNWYPASAANQMTVTVHMDNATSGPSTTVLANQYEFTDSTGKVHAHGFTFNPATISGYSSAAAHTFYFDTQGVSDVNGNPSTKTAVEQQQALNARGFCNTPPTVTVNATCTQVTGKAIDPDNPSASLTVKVYYNGSTVPDGTTTTNSTNDYVFTTPAAIQNSFSGTIPVKVEAVDFNDNTVSTPQSTNVTGTPCGHVSCSVNTVPSLPIEASTPFTWSGAVTFTGPPPAGSTVTITVASPLGSSTSAANNGTQTITNVPGGGSPGLPAGNYAANWSLSNPAISGPCNPIRITDLPYFRVFGSDISAGGGFDCTNAGAISYAGSLGGWYNNGSPLSNSFGSSSQFAATALGQILAVGSSQGSAAGAPKGLSLANTGGAAVDTTTGSNPSPQLGGGFGGGHCIYNPNNLYSTPMPADTSTNVTVGGGSGGDPTNGAYDMPAGSAITLNGGTVGVGKNIVVNAHGDVYIAGDISYAGGWASTADVPSFLLSTTGNIFISKDVRNLDGIYEATGGNIYTCSTGLGMGALVPAVDGTGGTNDLYHLCNKQLLVHGSFIAKRVNLMRTIGTLKDSSASETSAVRGGCTNDAGGNTHSCAGEVFDFSPEMYLGGWVLQHSASGAVQYDAISALPPVL